ncbi:MAG: FtsX-like permease family protein [Methanomassiliicoccales archaeon]|nr:MAG: FtsX-like permease family protein [Methanomassiliicoccales archaeon]
MEREKDQEKKFGVVDYISGRLKYYWIRYTMMLVVMTISVAIFLIVLSLFTGLQLQESGFEDPNFILTPEVVTQNKHISEEEANALVGWLIVAALFLFISSVGTIFSTIRCSVLYSGRDIAILKSIGLTKREISRIFIYEAMWLSLASWASGLLIGLIVSNQFFYHYYLEQRGSMFFAPAKTMPWLVVLSFLITVMIAYAGSIGPASRASKLDLLEAMGGHK